MLDKIDWEKVNGLIPAIIQDAEEGYVLMHGVMNREALRQTLEEGVVTFYSRTKKRLWTKGETSGNSLNMTGYALDCDQDTLLITVHSPKTVCHLDTPSCFNNQPFVPFLQKLEEIIDERFAHGSDHSYVKTLYEKGACEIAKKVGEEAVEVAIASATGDRPSIIEESADLLFHLLVNLRYHKIDLKEVLHTLKERTKP